MAVTDERYGFHFEYRMCGARPTILDLLHKDTETLTKGDLVNLESGELDLAATGDTAILGAVKETGAGTDSTTRKKVIVDADAVYSVYDANARLAGATLDIDGATGAMTVAATSNADLIVVAESTATQRTLVMINHDAHAWLS